MKNYFLITFICVILSIGELNAQAIDKQTSKEGKVWYKITSNTGKVGVADKDGNIIIPAEHYRISYFDDANVYKVYSDRMHICLYDLSGKPLIYNDSGFNYIHYYAFSSPTLCLWLGGKVLGRDSLRTPGDRPGAPSGRKVTQSFVKNKQPRLLGAQHVQQKAQWVRAALPIC